MNRTKTAMSAAMAALAIALASPAQAGALATQTIAPSASGRTWTGEAVVEAARQSAIAPQVPARIVEMRVRAGDVVKAGQVLLRLDARTAADQVASARAQVAAAEAQLEAARREYDRNRRLHEKKYISQAAMDQAEAQFKAAEAQARAAIAQAGVAATQSTFTALTAPYAGVVAAVNAEVGDLASPGMPIVTMYDPAELRVVVQLPESEGRLLVAGAPVRITIPAATGETQAVVAARTVILPTANPATHTREVRLSLPADVRGISPGMFARADFALSSPPDSRIVVPAAAIVRRPEFAAVYVLDAAGRPQLRQVRLGREAGNGVEVAAGLAVGDRIATDAVAAAAAAAAARQ